MKNFRIEKFPTGAKNAGKTIGLAEMPNGEKFVSIYTQYENTDVDFGGVFSKNTFQMLTKVFTLDPKVMVAFMRDFIGWLPTGAKFVNIETGEIRDDIVGVQVKGCLYRAYSFEPFHQGQEVFKANTEAGLVPVLADPHTRKLSLEKGAPVYSEIFFDSTCDRRGNEWKIKDPITGQWITEDRTATAAKPQVAIPTYGDDAFNAFAQVSEATTTATAAPAAAPATKRSSRAKATAQMANE